MIPRISAALFLGLSSILTLSQVPSSTTVSTPPAASESAPIDVPHANELGFTFSLPSDWDVKDIAPALPALHQQLEKGSTSDLEKKGAACVQVPLLASHGSPKSVIEIVTLAFDCFGQKFTDKDLPAFAIGVAGGLKKTFTISDPMYGAYTLGTHSIWIERAQGALISQPETKVTVETVCSILQKGAACWIALVSDDAALQMFEHAPVTLEGETAPALVPATAFSKKPN